uniref:DoxX family protein n=1 Tax=Roseovarius indicus TaxID=540747 RepID=UPI003B528FB8
MKTLPWRHIYAGLLAAFFVIGGTLNIFASDAILADYERWGYPDWFHYVTGGLEWLTAVLIASPTARQFGNLLGCGVMAAAAATVLLHGETGHAVPPLTVFVLVALNGWITKRATARTGFRPDM